MKKSIRLNARLRLDILNAADEKKFGKQESALRSKITKAVHEQYAKENPELAKFTDDERQKWFAYSTNIKLESQHGRRLPCELAYAVPSHKCSFYAVLEKTSAALNAMAEEYNALVELRAKFRQDLSSVLSSCITAKQALELVPELKPFLPKDDDVTSTGQLIPMELILRVKAALK